ncbi:MAG: hypothetical protein EVB08_08240 [Synechococcus sp. MED-G135]|jgi:hypothetical protein|nr:MAG: hypothetical protein EVB08_08240 [Synechococcus sp. MED-G135]|tara:strand:- start:467 stop:760 length:294 start_codon:yes stop_codon:yes gene_type:complete
MVESSFDFAAFTAVNHLWPSFVEHLGTTRSQQAVRQALDLQSMHGKEGTVPVLFIETCGIALASSVLLREQTGLNAHGNGMVLILSKRAQELQLIWG